MSKYLQATRTKGGHAVCLLGLCKGGHGHLAETDYIGGFIQDPRFPRRLIGRWDIETGIELDMGHISDEHDLVLE